MGRSILGGILPDPMASLRSLIARVTPSPIRQLVRDMEARRSRRRLAREYGDRSTEEIFSTIWKENRWGSRESRSGAGSTLEATRGIREALPRIVKARGVRVLLDAPCGDFHWMQHVDLGGCRYIGLDIVKEMVAQLQTTFGRADREFMHGDIVQGPLPKANLVMCRDCLFHLSDEQVFSALAQFKATGASWLLTTTYPQVQVNRPGVTGGYRDINLCLPPFSLPEPTELIDEGQMTGSSTIGASRAVGLWPMSRIALPNRTTV